MKSVRSQICCTISSHESATGTLLSAHMSRVRTCSRTGASGGCQKTAPVCARSHSPMRSSSPWFRRLFQFVGVSVPPATPPRCTGT
eukprot:4113364-Lingulodinium_polyedra.AAC.1